MEKEELINKYFLKTLSAEEEKAFNVLLKSDSEFTEQFLFEKDVNEAVKENERSELKAKLQHFEKKLVKPSSLNSGTSSWKVFRIAASVALLVATGWYFYNVNSKATGLYDEYYYKYPNTVYNITRGNTDNSMQNKAFVAYEANNDEKAVTLFKKIKQTEHPGYIDFYLAQSYLNLGQDEAAIKILEQLSATEGDFMAEALWYLSMGYLKNNENKKAKTSLQRLIQNGSYKKGEAQVLLNKLD